MLRTLFVLGIGLVLSSGTATTHAEEPLDVLKKAITAHGGKETLAKVNARTASGKGSVSVGAVKFGYASTFCFQYPDQFRGEGSMARGDAQLDILHVVDGKNGWEKVGDRAAGRMTSHTLQAFRRNLQVEYASTLVPLLDEKKYSVSSIGESVVNAKKAIGLNVKDKADESLFLNLYFDQKTHLMVKQEYSSKNMFLGGDVLVETYLSQHKKVDGIMVPMQQVVHYDGKQAVTFEFKGMQLHKELDRILFEKPE